MMSRIGSYLRGISVLVSDVALICLAMGLIPLLAKWEMYIALPVWIGYLCLLFLADDLMAVFGVPMNAYLIGNGAAIAAGTYLTCRYSWCVPNSMDIQIIIILGAVGTGVHGAFAAYRLPGSNGILRYVDCLIVVMAFYLYAVFSTGMTGNPEFIPAALAAMAIDLLAVNQLRTGDESRSVIRGAGAGGKLILILILIACFTVTGAIVGLASGQVHSIVDFLLAVMTYLWKIADKVLGFIGKILGGIILFIVMLLPATPKAARQNMADSVQESAEEILENTGLVLPSWVLCAVLGAGAAILAGWIMYQLRDTVFRRKMIRRSRHRLVRKSYLIPAVIKLLSQIKEGLVFELAYRRCRKTPEGLLVLAERTGKQKKLGRAVSESPGEYMRRLDRVLKAQQEQGAEGLPGGKCSLSQLGELLDRTYYAEQPCELTPLEYQNYVRQIRAIQ